MNAHIPHLGLRGDPALLPEGYASTPLHAAEGEAALGIHLILRQEAARQWAPIRLRDLVDGVVFLGAVVDRAGQIQDWLEIWVQAVERIAGSPAAARENVSNGLLDERWAAACQALAGDVDADHISTGWEKDHPAPMYVAAETGRVVETALRLCVDDQLLAQHGLPPYHTSLHRYLVREQGGGRVFYPATSRAPRNEHTGEIEVALGMPCAAINAEGGLLMVRRFHPWSLDEFQRRLQEAVARPGLLEEEPLLPGVPLVEGGLRRPRQRLLGGFRQGPAALLGEVLHLKICLLAHLVRKLASVSARLGRPMFNLTPASWRVQLWPVNELLPLYWTSRVQLADPGDALQVRFGSSHTAFLVRGREAGQSPYRMAVASRYSRGEAAILMRSIDDTGRDGVVVTGTVRFSDEMQAAPQDFLWFGLDVSGRRFEFPARLDMESSGRVRDWRFRSVPQMMDASAVNALRSGAGVSFDHVTVEIHPSMGSACDLYSASVIALHFLLCGEDRPLAAALDDLLALAADAEREGVADGELAGFMAARLVQDPRWRRELGPQHVVASLVDPERALSAVPHRLWGELLAVLVRGLTGMTKYSSCKHAADSPPGGAGNIFADLQAGLQRIGALTNQLVLKESGANEELRIVLAELASATD